MGNVGVSPEIFPECELVQDTTGEQMQFVTPKLDFDFDTVRARETAGVDKGGYRVVVNRAEFNVMEIKRPIRQRIQALVNGLLATEKHGSCTAKIKLAGKCFVFKFVANKIFDLFRNFLIDDFFAVDTNGGDSRLPSDGDPGETTSM